MSMTVKKAMKSMYSKQKIMEYVEIAKTDPEYAGRLLVADYYIKPKVVAQLNHQFAMVEQIKRESGAS